MYKVQKRNENVFFGQGVITWYLLKCHFNVLFFNSIF